MFIGEYLYQIDEKGRVSIPTKFRPKLSEGCVITRGLDKSLVIYTLSDFEKIAQKIAKLPITQSDARAFSRFVLSGAVNVNLDSQGRIIIPQYLRDYAGIKNEVAIIGLFDRFEIWDKSAWEKYKKQAESESENIAEQLENFES